ncbi:MAG: hypothetical protein WAM70_09595 [Pyrinomonadaceae bacterium]
MKDTETDTTDELRPEYDLKSLRIRKVGPGRKTARRRQIRVDADAGLNEYREGRLKTLSDVDDLVDSLSDD